MFATATQITIGPCADGGEVDVSGCCAGLILFQVMMHGSRIWPAEGTDGDSRKGGQSVPTHKSQVLSTTMRSNDSMKTGKAIFGSSAR